MDKQEKIQAPQGLVKAACQLHVSLRKYNARRKNTIVAEVSNSIIHICSLCSRLNVGIVHCGSISTTYQVKIVCLSLPRRLTSSSPLKSKCCGVTTEAGKRRKVVLVLCLVILAVNADSLRAQRAAGALKYSHPVLYLKCEYLR